jgi:hypothetical protein
MGDTGDGSGTDWSPKNFWGMMDHHLGIPIFDQGAGEPRSIDWHLSYSTENAANDPARRQLILDNVTKQAGVTFKHEKRSFITWKLTAISRTTVPSTLPAG